MVKMSFKDDPRERCCGCNKTPTTRLVLPTNVPHCETNVLVLDGLHVEACRKNEWLDKMLRAAWLYMRHEELTNRGDGRDDLSELQLVEDGGLTSCVETNLPRRSSPNKTAGQDAHSYTIFA